MMSEIPKGIQEKALLLGYSVEVKRRGLAAAPPLYRFSKLGRVLTRWLTLALAHNWLDAIDEARALKGDRT